ncbi:MAG: alpha/beta fold hydrolase, partial [Antricoccus sp.]
LDGVSEKVYYRHWDVDSPKAAIVFLHGFGEHTGLYDRYAAALATRGIALWALDHPGHGRSDGRRGYVESLSALSANARTLLSVVAEQLPGVPITLQGHSLGAATALYQTLTDSSGISKLVLSGAPLAIPDWIAESERDAGNTIELDPTGLSRDLSYLSALADDPLCFTDGEEGESLASALAELWQLLPDHISELKMPLLLIHGDDDQVAPFDIALRESERAADRTVVSFAGGKHDIINDIVHAEVAAAVSDFVLGEMKK